MTKPRFLRAVDDLYRNLGLITINFGQLEFRLQLFVAQLMRKARGSSEPTEVAFQLRLAFLITSELRFYKLTEMLESLFKHMEQNQEPVAELVALMTQANKAANRRDQVAHSQWLGSPDEPPHLRRVKITAKSRKGKSSNLYAKIEKLNPEEIADIAELLRETEQAIHDFMDKHGYGTPYQL